MKTMKWVVVVLAAMFLSCIAFVAGLEIGHRMGYDIGWVDCKFDAKAQLGLTECKEFWQWHGSRKSAIRKRRSLFE